MPHRIFRRHLRPPEWRPEATGLHQSARRMPVSVLSAGLTTCGWIGAGLLVAALLTGCGHTDAGQLDYSAASYLPDFISSDVPPQSEPELVLEDDGPGD